MTAIAAITPFGCPVLLGDLLISSRHPGAVPITALPTYNEPIRLHQASSYQIIELRQKTCIINGNIALAWSGGMMMARAVWRTLSEASKSGTLCLRQVKDILDSLEPDMRSDCLSVAGHVVHPEDAGSFSFLCEKTNDLRFGSARVAGMGADMLKAVLSRIHEMQQTDQSEPSERALGLSLLLAGNLIAEELLTQNTLRRFFGGGYELVILEDGQFVKLGDVTYVWWQCEVNGSDFIVHHPRRAMRLAYSEDVLLIRTLDMHTRSTAHAFDEHRFVVQPLYKNNTANNSGSEFPIPDMNGRYVCHLFSYQRGDEVRCLARAVVDRSDGPGVRFTLDGEFLDIYIDKDFLNEIAGQVLG